MNTTNTKWPYGRKAPYAFLAFILYDAIFRIVYGPAPASLSPAEAWGAISFFAVTCSVALLLTLWIMEHRALGQVTRTVLLVVGTPLVQTAALCALALLEGRLWGMQFKEIAIVGFITVLTVIATLLLVSVLGRLFPRRFELSK